LAGPPNITSEFITRLITNAADVYDSWPNPAEGLLVFLGPIGIYAAKKLVADPMLYFRNKVRAGGDWDFKSNWLKSYSQVEIAGQAYLRDMPGNFHYGYVGSAAGVSDSFLFSQAGKAQVSAGTSKPEYWCTDDDDPMDHEFIRLGIKLYDDYGFFITEPLLKTVLGQYREKTCGEKPRELRSSHQFRH
jgi:Bacterial toxin 44